MALIRKKKGNIVIALLMFVISLAVVICGIFFGPAGKTVTLFGCAFGVNLDFKHLDTLKLIKLNTINFTYLVVYLCPVVTSFFALVLRRYRFVNIANTLMFALAAGIWLIPLLPALGAHNPNLKNIFQTYDSLFYIILGMQSACVVLGWVNSELCR